MTGDDTTDEWALEGRRLVPLMPRTVPQTAYSVIADDEANKASIENEKLPHPASTERKRPLQTAITEQNKNIQYATNEFSASKHSNQVILKLLLCKHFLLFCKFYLKKNINLIDILQYSFSFDITTYCQI